MYEILPMDSTWSGEKLQRSLAIEYLLGQTLREKSNVLKNLIYANNNCVRKIVSIKALITMNTSKIPSDSYKYSNLLTLRTLIVLETLMLSSLILQQ